MKSRRRIAIFKVKFIRLNTSKCICFYFILFATVLSHGRNEVRWRPGKKQVWRPYVRTWRFSEANVLYWRKYLWHCLDLSAPPAVIRRPQNDSAPGELCLLMPPRYVSVPQED